MSKPHPFLMQRAPRPALQGSPSRAGLSRLGLGLRLGAALRAGGSMGALAVLPLALGSRAQAQDTLPPRLTLASPANNSFARALPTISGTVVDVGGPGAGVPASGVRDVQVGIYSASAQRWWSGSAFDSPGIVRLNATVSGSNWSYAAAPVGAPLPDGQYIVQAYATDNVGSAGGPGNDGFAESSAFIDNTAPSNVTFEQPTPGAQVTTLATVSGRAFDNTGGSGVRQVQLAIQRQSDGLYWNGSAYQAAQALLATTFDGGFWTVQTGLQPGATLPDGSYVLTAFARDAVGNTGSATQTTSVQQPPPPPVPDTTAPQVALSTPADGVFARAIAAPSGTASDAGGSGLRRVVVAFYSAPLQKWWDGAAFSSDTIVELPQTTINGGSWAFTGAVPSGAALANGYYTVIAFADDNAGNRSRAQSVVPIDNAAPSNITFEQPTPGAQASSLTDISGRAFDNTDGSGVATVQLSIQRQSDSQYWNGSSYQAAPVRLDASFGGGFWSIKTTLRSGADLPPGAYVLTAFVRDRLGNEGQASQSTTVVAPTAPPVDDTTPPQITLATPADGTSARSIAAPSGLASDSGGSGLQRVRVAFFRASDQRWWDGTAFSSSTIVELDAALTAGVGGAASTWSYATPPSGTALTDGTYVVLAFADDGDGNRGRTQSVVTIDNTRPASLFFEQPKLGATVTSLADINGFAADNPGGVGIATVQVAIRNSAGQYWNGTAFVDAEARLSTTVGGGFWALQTSLASGTNLPDGSYSLTAYAEDRLGNSASASIAVVAQAPTPPSPNPSDITPPRIALASPANNSSSKTFPRPSGTASDEAGGSGLRDVRVAFFRSVGTGGQWWDGTAFASSAPVELDATISGNGWAYNGALPSGAQLPDGLYVVLAFADDRNGNRNRAQAVLTIDTTAPSRLTFESPSPNAIASTLASIYGRVQDGSGGAPIKGVQVAVRNARGQFWNGSTYQAAAVRLPAQVSGTFWSLRTRLVPGAALPAGVYTLTAYAQDIAGNEKIVTQRTRVIPDIVAPVVRWASPTAGVASLNFPALTGTAVDAGGSGLAGVGVELIRVRRTPSERNAWWNGRNYQAAPFRLATRVVDGRWEVTAPLPKVPYLFSTNYTAVAFAADGVGNVASRDVSFFIDRFAPPAPLFGLPRPNSTVSSLGPIVITVRDSPNPGQAGSGVSRADFLIRRDRDARFWNGSAYSATPVYLPGYQVSASQFRRDGVPSGTNLPPGFYTIQARIADGAGNLSISSVRVQVRDAVAPSVSIYTPVSGQLRRDFGVIVGGASDNAGGSGLASVRVSIRRASDGAYWNGTAFTPSVASVAAAISGAGWALRDVPPASLITPGSYEVTAVATDRDSNSARARVVVPLNPDSTPATVTISDPSPDTIFRSLERITGTAVDNAGGVGLDRVVVGILRNSDGLFWNGRAFTDTFFPFRATLSGSDWALRGSLLPSGATGQFTVIAQAFDKLSNVPQGSRAWQKQVTFRLDPSALPQGEAPTAPDRTPATITVSDPRPNTTFRRIERITGTAVDNAGGVGLDRVVVGILRNSDGLFWNGSSFSSATLVPLPATVNGSTWSLTAGLPPAGVAGGYTILAQAFDRANNFSQRDVPITLDPSAPAQGAVPSTPAT